MILGMTRCAEMEINLESVLSERKPSIFQVSDGKRDSGDAVKLNIDGDKIVIGLRSDVYRDYANYGLGRYKRMVFSGLILPALVEVLWEMKLSAQENQDRDGRSDTRWYRAIRQKMEQLKISLEDSSPIEVAQQIFRDPMSCAFKDIKRESDQDIP
jgi:hypothetical protein